ncbi:hypothetical protein GA0070616_0946 [Micromonospora nigra]|uniref:Helix-turn-helix domain-containing protein n=1 Tax=Micromonospora nigra TaxID=145857 RepID=A0A1C6RGP7_9ACTN|nr:hypothetical protein [Micromonospora nigra]SCL16164.1 hypothetical protein GA0070616_0946 [Micromonospora nigra]
MTPSLTGPTIARLRLAKGWSQSRLAAELCAAAGVPTLSRHEVSRWERQARVPGAFWRGWLAVVLDAPAGRLDEAAAHARRLAVPTVRGTGARSRAALLALAHRFATTADTPLPMTAGPAYVPPRGVAGAPAGPRGAGDPGGAGPRGVGGPPGEVPADGPPEAALAELRRMDDLCGGVDLVGLGRARWGRAVRALTGAGPVGRRRLLPVVAESAQLAGWLAADAGDPEAGLDAYRLALRAASAAGDPALAGHVLGCASHLLAGLGDPAGALLLATAGHTGAGRRAGPGLRALLLHRVALAAALAGRVAAAGRALDAARRVTEEPAVEREPGWLYWLDGHELARLTGRTLVALGRPRAAEMLLVAGHRRGGPRDRAVYGTWLARCHLEVGEVEQACAAAGAALLEAIRAGSPRAVRPLAALRRRLAPHHELPAVRRYAALLAATGPYLPRGPGAPWPGPTPGWSGASWWC